MVTWRKPSFNLINEYYESGVTGHTKGLGKELYNRFGDVKGFSSSNDYDVSDRYDRAKIINEIHKFDLFINNASIL